MMKGNMMMNEEDAHLFSSHLFPNLYNHAVSIEGVSKTRRRRKKNKGEAIGDVRKRKLSVEQVSKLEMNFSRDHNLETERKERIAVELGLDHKQVAIWFQNRRVRWRVKKLEDEYSKLKATHESVVVERSQLEAEVLSLKAQLSNAHEEIKMFAERSDGASRSSQGSFFDMEPQFLGENGVEGFENFYYVFDNNSMDGMEWVISTMLTQQKNNEYQLC
ncbi:hypothetical protein IFM89_032464 [Coptis chinensis]|uniref:Homeobox-leucine zipper protein n=1 Tax=Coptis chinensis TaxID=261450 RepID=A0A835I6U4_9MAGN|nr:hypothetical protein IFM89_032464 [Coptis chinensis]